MIGGLLFTTFSSANFGQNAKSWRLFADYINNVGITLDLLAPLSAKLFLPLICLSSVFKSLCGIAAGAAGAVISEHWGSLYGELLHYSCTTLYYIIFRLNVTTLYYIILHYITLYYTEVYHHCDLILLY